MFAERKKVDLKGPNTRNAQYMDSRFSPNKKSQKLRKKKEKMKQKKKKTERKIKMNKAKKNKRQGVIL